MRDDAGTKLSLTAHGNIVRFSAMGQCLIRDAAEDLLLDTVRGSGGGGGGSGGGRRAGSERGVAGGAQPPRLMPLIRELYILTKDRGMVRLGDSVERIDGSVGPVLNYAQVEVIEDAERQLAERGQVRAVVLKARQVGISTIIEAIAFTLTQLHDNFSALIVSHESKSTRGILEMTKRYWATYPFRSFAAPSRYDSAMHVSWVSGSQIQVATAKNLDAGRSSTLHFLHASEVAFWPEPETLFNGLRQAIPNHGLSAIFLESTANGIGNFFYRQCNAAMKGESEYTFHFFPWHKHPEYTAAFLSQGEVSKIAGEEAEDTLVEDPEALSYELLGDLDKEEQALVSQHRISPSRLLWRRWAIRNLCMNDVSLFHQEYPTTPHEAFVSTGRNVFPVDSLLAHYDPVIGKKGRLVSTGRGVEFVEDQHGWLTLFAEPSPDKDWGVYVAGGDPTHTTAGDYACIQVLNRRTLEQVAVYRRKINPTTFGKDMQLVGHFFNTALLAPERTGPGYATAGCITADGYPNVYITQNVTRQQGQPLDGVGWVTGQSTKHYAVSQVVAALADPLVKVGNHTQGLLIHDEQTFTELRDYVTTEDGRGYQNGDGSKFDDGVMALAIALSVHFIEPPPAPYEMVREDLPPRLTPAGSPRRARPYHPVETARPIDNQPSDTLVSEPLPDYDNIETIRDDHPEPDPEDFTPEWMKWSDKHHDDL